MTEEIPVDRLAANFQCFVCGAIFTTEQDKRQHVEKERHETAKDDDSEAAD